MPKTVCTIDMVFTLTSLKFSCALMVELGLVWFRLSSQPILLFDTELTSFPGPEKFWGREGDIFGFEICNLFWSPLNRFPSWIGCETDRDDKTYEWDLDLFLSHPGLIFPPLPEISFQLLCWCKQSADQKHNFIRTFWFHPILIFWSWHEVVMLRYLLEMWMQEMVELKWSHFWQQFTSVAVLGLGLKKNAICFPLGNFGQFLGLGAECTPTTGLAKRKCLQVNICVTIPNKWTFV